MECALIRRVMPMTLLAAMALAPAQPAFAAPPVAVPAGSVTIPAGQGCEGFDLKLAGSDGMVRVVAVKDKNGTQDRIITVATGVTITYTNLDTGESISFKTSGSVTSVVTDGNVQTVTATGHNGLILFPTDVPAGPTSTQYSGGKIVYTINTATGVFTLISASGNPTDVCASLS